MSIKKIYIDIGHGELIKGRNDPGAANGNLIEHQINIVVGNAIANRLKDHGYEVKVEPGDLQINESASLANKWGADFCISCHENAGGGDRGEVLYAWDNGSLELANAIALGLKNAGQTVVNLVKSKATKDGSTEYFGMLRVPKMPAVIIECAFIDNVNDRQLIDTVEKQKKVGILIADAIANKYGKQEIINGGDEEELTPANVIMNNQKLEAYIIGGKTFVEIRKPLEWAGKQVIWDKTTNTTTIK